MNLSKLSDKQLLIIVALLIFLAIVGIVTLINRTGRPAEMPNLALTATAVSATTEALYVIPLPSPTSQLGADVLAALPTPVPSRTRPFTYTVQTGDTLGEIATEFDVSVEAIKAANTLLYPDALEVGQELLIPADDMIPEIETPTVNESGSYTVVSGDTLFSIARVHGTTVDAIKAANGLASDLINPGDVLIIPQD